MEQNLTSIPAIGNTMLPAVAFIKKRNFSAELPDDFIMLKSITRADGNFLVKDDPLVFDRGWYLNLTETFMIRMDKIYFSGAISRYWIIRLCQRLWEWLFPSVYKLEYLRSVKP